MKGWVKYLLVTTLFLVVGTLMAGMAFISMFAGGAIADLVQLIAAVSLLATPVLFAYFVVKLFNVVWWYPGMLMASPAALWFVDETLSQKSNPQVLLLPAVFILALGLSAGKLGRKNRTGSMPNNAAQPTR